jgi:hypothetical protein
MKRINKNSVTDSLMEALENAESMEHVVILYQNKPDSETSTGFIITKDTEISTANYLLDTFKAWLFTCHLQVKDE